MTSTPQTTTLLCERCGYDIGGLTPDSECPECGQPLLLSSPRRRVGSAWQAAPGLRSLARTNLATLIHPVQSWDHISIEFVRSALLALLNIFTAAAAASGALLFRGPGFGPVAPMYAVSFLLGFAFLLSVLCLIEFAGIRFFGTRRGWRISMPVAMSVIGHASAGWLIGGILFGAGWHIAQYLSGLPQFRLPLGISVPAALTTWSLMLPLGGFFIGLLLFESLVFVGFRSLRFANSPDALSAMPTVEA